MADKIGKFAGRKEWISSHKLSLLVVVKALCRKDSGDQEYSECLTRCRNNISLLLLKLLQAQDLELAELCQKLRHIDPDQELHFAFLYWLKDVQGDDDRISSLIDFFQSLDNLFSGKEPVLQKSSLFGVFVRKMSLLFHKMTFSQVAHFQMLQQDYLNYAHGDQDESMDSNRGTDSVNNNKRINKISTSSRQAEFFLEKQASAIQNYEGAALSPDKLQNKLTQLLDISPDITETHFVSYLNCLRVGEFKQAIDSLYHYFDQQQWNTSPQTKQTNDVSNDTEDERCKRFRYAALSLAALHCRFGHRAEALASLKEAIKIGQETNDHVCLEHCLVWLYRLKEEGSSQATVLLDRFVSRAAELKLPYLTSLSMLTHARHNAIIGIPPPKVFQAMSHINVINSQNSLQDLTAMTHAQHAAIWQLYGKSHIAIVFSQLQLNQNNQQQSVLAIDNTREDRMETSVLQYGEATCMSLCNLAKTHADEGMYDEAAEILTFCKTSFPQPTNLSKMWMIAEAVIDHDKALQKGDIEQADKAVLKIAPLDETEATYRSALNMIHKGNTTEAFPLLQKLLMDVRNTTTINEGQKAKAELHTNVLLALCKLYAVSGNPLAAMPHLLDCLTLACSHYLDHTAALASMCIGHLQLLLGLPAKALVLVKTSMVHLLSHGSLYVQCCAQFLLVQCQLAVSLAFKSSTNRKQALLSALPTIDHVLSGFRKLQASHKVRDVLYQQARIYNELGYVEDRNRCSTECCQILKTHSKQSYCLSLHCL